MLTIEMLQKDMMAAMKAKDAIRKAALSSALAAVKKAAIDKNCRDNVTEEFIIDVIRKEIKILNEQIDTCPAERVELLEEFNSKKAVLNEYVPQLITAKDTIHRMIIQLCEGIELTKANKGLIMKTIVPQLKGKADMKVVQEVLDSRILVSK